MVGKQRAGQKADSHHLGGYGESVFVQKRGYVLIDKEGSCRYHNTLEDVKRDKRVDDDRSEVSDVEVGVSGVSYADDCVNGEVQDLFIEGDEGIVVSYGHQSSHY